MRSDRDEGFSLLEVLICVIMIGILAPTIAMVFTVIVRNSPSVQTRADDSRTSRGLATWLPQDVLSTPPLQAPNNSALGYNTDPALVSACSGATGVNVLHMVWQELDTTYVANYRYDPGITTRIKRYTCSSTSPTKVSNVTTPIGATSASAMPTIVMGRVVRVDVRVVTVSGVQVLIEAASRNPAEQLPN